MWTADHFAEFFRTVHGYDPFPWQTRLVRQVLADGHWPALLDLPTGSGKTSVLDVAVFALAADPARAPRRTVLVVDRRVIVDQAHGHAERIANALVKASSGVVGDVARALRACCPGSRVPLETAILRGGMPRDDAWARRPDQPLVATSTVDQVGSRLLFRGYGVSHRMASVHAGLFGNDTLIFLDEVHLSAPFAETLRAVRDRWRRWPDGMPDRWGVVEMSATPSSAVAEPFRLDQEDADHPRLRQRLIARKRTAFVEVRARGSEEDRRELVAKEAVKRARELVAAGARVVGIVVNRVDTARRARALLGDEGVLLTGRMRPLDRAATVSDEVLARVRAGRTRRDDDPTLVLVATQCVEAGADFDFDGLVTECASLDALRQRFGRLDRLGELSVLDGEAPPVRGVILARGDQLGDDVDDPVYGNRLAHTWAWLRRQGDEVDLGIGGPRPNDDELPTLVAPSPRSPVLLPAHLDAWAQTSPVPRPDPDVALWLHGPERGAPEVQVVWRADVTEEDLQAAVTDPEPLRDRLAACPPGSLEALAVPLHAVQRWLTGSGDADVADVDGIARPERADVEGSRLAFAWRSHAGQAVRKQIVGADDIVPGDTLVVPAARGGLRYGSWDPSCTDPVRDMGDRCQLELRGRATLRVDPRVLDEIDAGWVAARPIPTEDPDQVLAAEVAEWLAARPEAVPDLGPRPRIILHHGGTYTLVARNRRSKGESEVTTEDDGGSFTEREVTLREHSEDVRAFAERFTQALGLPRELAEDVVLAAWLHDVGKADPRFQRMLVGGSEVRLAARAELLAKSAIPLRDRAAREQARRRAGYPSGYRHELLSVALIADQPDALAHAHDRELVLHLVGSHHGWCRPFAPAVPDETSTAVEPFAHGDGVTLAGSTDHRLARLDSGVADRFWALHERYGPWGLAWLEALVRLADHRASEAAQRGGVDG